MTPEEYEISQEENPFTGQDDYLDFQKCWTDKQIEVQDLILELDNSNLSNQLVEAVTRQILTEKDGGFGWHRAIVKPLFKILHDRNMSDLLSEIHAQDDISQILYWIPGEWGVSCSVCDNYDLYHEADSSEPYMCNECDKHHVKGSN